MQYYENSQAPQRAVLVAVDTRAYDVEQSLDELEELARTAGAQVIARVSQARPAPDPATCIGSGRLKEVSQLVKTQECDLIIFDEDLTASQMRNIESAAGVAVVDRTTLILDLFAQRALSREGKLQVELAQQKYRLPRLMGLGASLSRLGGGIGTRGPGETQLETDRRHIHRNIDKLREDLEEVRRVRGTQRQQRMKNETPVVAIVGYTNAGKSTLLNALTGAAIPANNRLFDTLDTTSRLLTVSDMMDVVISDTVGFIRKLPHQLVDAFKATLEELEYADLLLHVIDVSNPVWEEQAAVVDALIADLGAQTTPCIRVYNKSDCVSAENRPWGAGSIAISAKTGAGLPELLALIERTLDKGSRRLTLRIPYERGDLLDLLYREAKVLSVRYEEATVVDAVCTQRTLGQVCVYADPPLPEKKEEWER